VSVLVTAATPAPGLIKRRAEVGEQKKMTSHQLEIRACLYCKTLYKTAGDAWRCEHYHHPVA
jgi:hypothetical protein